MPHADHSVIIDRAPHDVYVFVLHGENNGTWRSGVTDCACITQVCDAAGARYRQGMKGPGGRRIAADCEITGVRPDEHIAFRVTAGPARPTGSYQFKPLSGGARTEVRFVLDWKPTGLRHALSPVVSRQMSREVAALDDLKRTLERESSSGRSAIS